MAHATIAGIERLLGEADLLEGSHMPSGSSPDALVTGCSFDSREVAPHDVFFCKGAAFKPAFLESALDAGAACYIAEAALASALEPLGEKRGVPGIFVSDVRRAMAAVPPAVYGHPDEDLAVVGITGTKGKSSTAYMLRAILDAAGDGAPQTGIIGSIDTFDGVVDQESHNTTPEAPALWKHLANARDSHLPAMVMEVSSQALKYDRTLGLTFDVGCFLNIGLDHISGQEHTDFEDYFSSKLRIFKQCRTAVVNLESDHADRILKAAEAAPQLVTFGVERPDADICATDLETVDGEIFFTVRTRSFERRMHLPFPGAFNVSNALCAIAAAEIMGVAPDAMEQGLAHVVVPGRMEFFRSKDRRLVALVDYAHNRLSFEAVFSAVRSDFPGARIVALFGAAGCKALERRRELPEVAARYADYIVLANEDPWAEDPESICRDMESNLPESFRRASAAEAPGETGAQSGKPLATPHRGQKGEYEIILDREAAVNHAFQVARGYVADGETVVVMLLAKGRETDMHMANGWDPITPDTELAKRHVAAYDRVCA